MNNKTAHRANARFPASIRRLTQIALVFSLIAWPIFAADEDSKANTKPLTAEAIAPIADKLNDSQKQSLLSQGLLTVYYSGGAQTSLCPNAAAATEMTGPLAAVKPSIGIETLVVYPLPANLAARPDRDLVLYNIMHRFRSMEGIQYWSASRKAMRIFFTSSKLVKAPGDRSPQPDPVYAASETRHALFLEQEDSSFGKNLYDLDVQSLGKGSVLLNMSNRDQFWYGIVPVLAPRALSMYLFAQPSADGKYLYFYGNAGINAAKAFGVEEKAKTSFANRIVALFNWYAQELEGVK